MKGKYRKTWRCDRVGLQRRENNVCVCAWKSLLAIEEGMVHLCILRGEHVNIVLAQEFVLKSNRI